MLIAAGHGTIEDIGRLTARQIKLFFAEAQRADRRRRVDRVHDTNIAVNGKEGSASSHVRQLEEG